MARYKLPKLRRVRFEESKHLPQSVEDKLSDYYLTLLTIFLGENAGSEVNRLNLQKTIFLTKLLLYKEGIRFFNTGFYKFTYGPYQKRIHYVTQRLVSYDLIESEEQAGTKIKLTNEGVNFLLFTLEKFKKDKAYKRFLEISKDILGSFSGNTAGRLIDITHSMKVRVDGEEVLLDELEETEDYYLEPEEDVKVKYEIKAPKEAIANLISYRANLLER